MDKDKKVVVVAETALTPAGPTDEPVKPGEKFTPCQGKAFTVTHAGGKKEIVYLNRKERRRRGIK